MPTLYSPAGLVRTARRLVAGAALSWLAVGAAQAQVMPLYRFSTSTAAYAPITGGTAIDPTAGGGSTTPTDDGFSTPQPLPFSFPFGANTFNSYVVTTNGWITFGPGATTYNTPLNQGNNQMIAFFAKDLRSDGPSTAYSATTTGTAPNRIHKIQANQFVQWNNTSAEGSAQVWLYENGNIEIHYGNFNRDWTPGSTNGVQVGIRGNDIRDVRAVMGTWSAPIDTVMASALLPNTGANGEIPGSNQVFRFTFPTGDLTPPTVGAVTITPAGGACLPTSHAVSVRPSDASGIQSVTLYYTVGNNPQQTVPMTNAGGTYSATIPAQGTNSVRYFVAVRDAGTNRLVTRSAVDSYRDGGLTINAGPDLNAYVGELDTLTASASLGGTVRITEFTLYSGGIGATNPYPAYFPSSAAAGAADFVEITNLGTGTADISGYGFEIQSGAGARTYSFPNGTTIPGREVLVLHIGSGTDDVGNRFYNTGGGSNTMFSGDDESFVLTSGTGQVVDVVVVNGASALPPATGADWSGNGLVSPATVAGAGLYGPDLNSAAGWADAQSAPQTMGSLNPGLPTVQSTTGVTWTGPGLTSPVPNPLVTPNYPAPGVYTYIASVSNGSCTATDTVVIRVQAPQPPTPNFIASTTQTGIFQPVQLLDRSTNRPTSWHWRVTPAAGANFYNTSNGGANARNADVAFTQVGIYTVTLTVTNAAGQDSLTKTGYIRVGSPRYCAVQGSDCSIAYLDAVVIKNTDLRNRGTHCDNPAIGYVAYPQRDSTTAQLHIAQRYTMMVTGYSTGGIAAWIDWNNNNQYDSIEYILVTTRPNPHPGQPDTVTFMIPDSMGAITNVPVGMRVRNRRTGDILATEACRTFNDGETEDYLVTILPPVPPIVGTPAGLIKSLAVYPNPSAGSFRVSLQQTGAHRIELAVTDALGRVVHQQTAQDNTEAEVNLNSLSTGVYILRISLDGQVGYHRIEIQK